jgi:hypothetical protein
LLLLNVLSLPEEKIPMKLKALLLTIFLIAGCMASPAQSAKPAYTDPYTVGQTITLAFLARDGEPYCNYEVLTYQGHGQWTGYDMYDQCGYSVNAQVAGFSINAPNDWYCGLCLDGIPGSGGGFPPNDPKDPISGAGIVYGDNSMTSIYGYNNYQYTVFTKVKPNKVAPDGKILGQYGWTAITNTIDPANENLVVNFGYLTTELPNAAILARSRHGHETSASAYIPPVPLR